MNDVLYGWLKEYAARKHSKMATIITSLLVNQKETDEVEESTRQSIISKARKSATPTRRK
jgi:hypothetical protein